MPLLLLPSLLPKAMLHAALVAVFFHFFVIGESIEATVVAVTERDRRRCYHCRCYCCHRRCFCHRYYCKKKQISPKIIRKCIPKEAESLLYEGLSFNYEETRALPGRLEYQGDNVEAALRLFDGMDLHAILF